MNQDWLDQYKGVEYLKNKIKQIGISSYIIFMPIGYLFHMKDKKNNYIDIRHVGSKR